MLNWVMKLTPWQGQFHSAVPQYAVFALFFGLGVDSLVDFAVTKIPWLRDWLPQMPAPLKSAVPSDQQVSDQGKKI
jgi:hypothetical protein